MSANFCTNCGQRLQQPTRYCDNCGASIENLAPSESSSPARQTLRSGLAGLGLQVPKLFRETGDPETDTRPWALDFMTLNALFGCSVMNAPLDTGFLILRIILQLPLSGFLIKQRLRDHEHWISETLKHVKDTQLQSQLNRAIASLRATQKQIPDGFAHHIYCVAFYTRDNKALDTVFCEEEWEKTEPAGLLARTPQRGLQTLRREALLSGGRPPKTLRAGLWSGTAFSGSVKRH